MPQPNNSFNPTGNSAALIVNLDGFGGVSRRVNSGVGRLRLIDVERGEFMDAELPAELEAINELQKHLVKVFVLLSSQLIDVRATVGATLDAQRDLLVKAEYTQIEAEERLQSYLDRREKDGSTQLSKEVASVFGKSTLEEFDFDGPAH